MNNKINPSYKVIADHLRSTSFLIADGVLPSNEGRGYVLRRIMRRAMLHSHKLNAKETFIYKLAPTLIEQMGDAYPELKRAQDVICATIKDEEEKFKKTLENGIKLLEEEVKNNKGNVISGKIAFKLYDTYGFPLDLTQNILKEKNIEVNLEEFDEEMAKQKKMAKEHWSGSGEKQDDLFYFQIKEKFGTTKFVGYDEIEVKAKILTIIVDGKEVEKIDKNTKNALIILDRTPFYATSGGQKGDNGKILKAKENSEKSEIEISETRKIAGELFGHFVSNVVGEFKIGEEIIAQIDNHHRKSRAKNHSATHLLHYILRNKLGAQLTQKGSNVDSAYLTFDFNFNRGIEKDELEEIEDLVNYYIQQNSEVRTEVLPLETAQKNGAIALFGEKYDDEVRVLSMAKDDNHETDLSVEFCGGTHVKRTGDIGLFKIISEKSIASGIRRITACSGDYAIKYLREEDKKINELVESLNTKIKQKDKEIEKLKKEKLSGNSAEFASEKIGEINLIHHLFENVEAKDLRDLITQIKSKKENESNCVILFFSSFEGKISVALAVSQNLIEKFSASKLIPAIVEIIGGKGGGGKPDLAFGGGNNSENIQNAIQNLKENLK